MRKNTLVVLAFLASTVFFAIQARHSSAVAKSGGQHLLLQVVWEKNVFTVVKTTLVPSALPLRRARDRFFAWQFKVTDAQDKIIFEAGLDDPTWIRGEFRNEKDPSKIDGYRVKRKEPVHFTIRVPARKARSISFFALKPDQVRKSGLPAQAFARLGAVDFPALRTNP